MAAPPHLPPSNEDTAAVLVQLLKPGAWIPQKHARWIPVIESLLEAFLRQFDPALLTRLLDQQRALPPSVSTAERAARMAGELTALHKLCQMLARTWRRWGPPRRRRFQIRQSQRRLLWPGEYGQICSWTWSIRKLLAAA